MCVRQDLIDTGRYHDSTDLKGLKIAVSSVQSQFYAEQIMPKANALLEIVKSGASTALALGEDCF